FLALLHGNMDHPVVARLRQHRHRRSRDLRAGVNRPHVRTHQPGPPERLVNRGDTERGKCADGVRIGAFNIADDDRLHRALQDSGASGTFSPAKVFLSASLPGAKGGVISMQPKTTAVALLAAVLALVSARAGLAEQLTYQ